MGQLGALVSLRWRMVRSTPVRRGLLLLAALLPLLVAEAVVFGQSVPEGDRRFDVLLLAPTAYLVFAGLALAAPLVTGGGNQLFPDEQLVAYPVQPRTVFSGGLLMAPLNLAWSIQVVGLAGVTAITAQRGTGVLLSLVTLAAYVAFVTTAGHALAWAVLGLRTWRVGRVGARVGGGLAALAAVAVVALDEGGPLLDRSPTTRVVIAAVQGSQGRAGPWLVVTLVLTAGAVVSVRLGQATCAWALRRPQPAHGTPELAPVVRRASRRTGLAELVAVDRASVWRSTPLRRGTLFLAVLPGAIALMARPSWVSLTMLPGLVAAGAGLLFGVNAFCLDGAGSAWVATLPHPPRTTLVSKLVVTGQTCLAAVGLALAVAVVRVEAAPTAAEALAVAGSALGATLLVVAVCGRLSVTHPHKADLRGRRDTPAPPATMAVYSLRLAVATTWPSLLFTAAAASGSGAAAVFATVAVVCWSARSLHRTVREWGDPVRRARVVTTVSYG